jgi:HPt (histidine-containing phosphotransfer) domain-containing protein
MEEESLLEKHIVDTENIAALIGISEEEYIHFLDDFRKESSKLEENLRGNNLKESREATFILKEASLLLHLPHIAEKLDELSSSTSDEKETAISGYFELLAATVAKTTAGTPTLEIDLDNETKDATIGSLDILSEGKDDIHIEPLSSPKFIPETSAIDQESIDTSLDDVQPIPFDFSINEAADELTLPASLVSEFIVDFINQAKENLPILHKAHENKDLDTLQKTAHMLKGASSNLRITPMADTLYNLQFNDYLEKVPELLEFFTGQLKALSIQMDQVS